MAPEIIQTFTDDAGYEAHGYGMGVDVWSLGVVLYMLLAGEPPVEENGLFARIRCGFFKFDSTAWKDITSGPTILISQMLVTDPIMRVAPWHILRNEWVFSGKRDSFQIRRLRPRVDQRTHGMASSSIVRERKSRSLSVRREM